VFHGTKKAVRLEVALWQAAIRGHAPSSIGATVADLGLLIERSIDPAGRWTDGTPASDRGSLSDRRAPRPAGVHGAPIDSDGLLRNAHSTSRRYKRAGKPFVAISAEITLAGWSLESILAGPRVRTRRTYALVRAGLALDAGFELLATFYAPHYSVVLPSYDVESTQLLSSLFGEAQKNIYFGRSVPA